MPRKMPVSSMPHEASRVEGDAEAPLALTFSDLFEQLGTFDVRYSAAVQALAGRRIMIEGFLSRSHGPQPAFSLVDQPGVCPDCSPVPAAVIALPGARASVLAEGDSAVRAVGCLDYGFRIDAGIASVLRIEGAVLLPVEGGTCGN